MRPLRLRLPGIVVELRLPADDLAREAAARYRLFRTAEPPDLRLDVAWTESVATFQEGGPPRLERLGRGRFRLLRGAAKSEIDFRRRTGRLAARRSPSDLDTALRVIATISGLQRGVAFFHAAAIRVGRAGYLFPAPSEGGKTTLVAKCRRSRTRDTALTDEIAAVTVGARPVVSATPFWGAFRPPSTATSAPLRRILFLAKGPPALTPLPVAEAAVRLLRLMVFWGDAPEWVQRTLALAGRLATLVPAAEARYDVRRTGWRAFRRRFLDA